MATKPRGDGQTAVSISLPDETLKWMDKQRAKLHLSRSAYVRLAIDRKTAGQILMAAEECQPEDKYKTKRDK